MEPLEFFASCLAGTEQLLAEELKGFDIKRIRPLNGGVAFFCTLESAYRACLWSRLASRVVLVLSRFDAPDASALYEGVARLPWKGILADDATFTVRAHGTNAELRNTRFTALKAKDAIADCLRQQLAAKRPQDRAAGSSRAVIDVRLRGSRATVSLDFCGEALSHRPYLFSDDGPDVPLRCVMAAAALAYAGWPSAADGGAALMDPACGDGILLVEAASIACRKAPALERARWGFTGWRGHDPALWEALVREAEGLFEAGLAAVGGDVADAPRQVRFIGTSASSPAIARGRRIARKAGLGSVVSIERGVAADQASVAARLREACGFVEGAPPTASPFFAASVVDGLRRADAVAAVEADEAALVAAARALGSEGVTVALDGLNLRMRFPEDTCRACTLGNGRVEAKVEVFQGEPAEEASIQVLGLDDGVPRDVTVFDATSQQFAARLRKVFKERRRQAARQNVGCYRIYDYDLPEYAVAIDLYTGALDAAGNLCLSIAEYAPPASVDADRARRRFHDVLAIAPVVCGVRPDHVFAKRRERSKGGAQYRHARGRSYALSVEEGGYLFQVDLARRLDTGLFLDHRQLRALLGVEAAGKDFLNLFAYTGTASVYAAGGGAASTLTVDLSQPYLDWARRNMEANGFSGPRHRFQKADVLKWITQARRSRQRFDLVFVDPPTFSNSKAMGKKTWDVQRDHVELLIGVVHLLKRGGQVIFSCNLRNFKPDTEKLAGFGITLKDITAQTIPFDFARTPKIHHCYRVTWEKAL